MQDLKTQISFVLNGREPIAFGLGVGQVGRERLQETRSVVRIGPRQKSGHRLELCADIYYHFSRGDPVRMQKGKVRPMHDFNLAYSLNRRSLKDSVKNLSLHCVLEITHKRMSASAFRGGTISGEINLNAISLEHVNGRLREVVTTLISLKTATAIKPRKDGVVGLVGWLEFAVVNGHLVAVKGND